MEAMAIEKTMIYPSKMVISHFLQFAGWFSGGLSTFNTQQQLGHPSVTLSVTEGQ